MNKLLKFEVVGEINLEKEAFLKTACIVCEHEVGGPVKRTEGCQALCTGEISLWDGPVQIGCPSLSLTTPDAFLGTVVV